MINIYILIIFVGLFCGFIGSFGIHGVIFIVPLLMTFDCVDDYKMSLGTMLFAAALPLSLGSAIYHYKCNNVKIDFALLIAAAYFIGSFLATKYFVYKLSENNVLLISIILLLILLSYYLYKYFKL